MSSLHTPRATVNPCGAPRLRVIAGGRTQPLPRAPWQLKIYQDPEDAQRTVLCGSMAQVCEALDRLAAQVEDACGS